MATLLSSSSASASTSTSDMPGTSDSTVFPSTGLPSVEIDHEPSFHDRNMDAPADNTGRGGTNEAELPRIPTMSSGMDQEPTQGEEEPVKFVLLAEFDIDQGATLTHQYPFPTGTDEQ